MKVLLVNKYLFQKGGAETYVIKLGKQLRELGHEVEYFGMEHEDKLVYNSYDLYVKEKNFSSKKIFNVLSLISNKEAYKKMCDLLRNFQPDLVISNNIEFHLTPSIIEAFGKYKKDKKNVKWFYVAHDYQIVCPSHGLFDNEMNICEKCLDKQNYWNCFYTKCHKNSKIKSLIATLDSIYWHKIKKVYKYVDCIICPSYFMQSKINTDDRLKNKTKVIHNFVDKKIINNYQKKDYIIEFGKLCKDKGTETLLDVVEELPEIEFVFAGYGESEERIKKYKNANYVGFKTGKELEKLISEAKISICPSEWYENCPFSVIESQMYGTPVIGANIGGIPELIEEGKTGEIFESKNKKELKNKILELYNNEKLEEYYKNCKVKDVETLETYCKKIIDIFEEAKK